MNSLYFCFRGFVPSGSFPWFGIIQCAATWKVDTSYMVGDRGREIIIGAIWWATDQSLVGVTTGLHFFWNHTIHARRHMGLSEKIVSHE